MDEESCSICSNECTCRNPSTSQSQSSSSAPSKLLKIKLKLAPTRTHSTASDSELHHLKRGGKPSKAPKPAPRPSTTVTYRAYPRSAVPTKSLSKSKAAHLPTRAKLIKSRPKPGPSTKKSQPPKKPTTKKRRRVTPSDESSLDELTPSDDDDFAHRPAETSAFPTFISASESSSSDSESSSLTEESDESDLDGGDDDDLKREEERMLMKEALKTQRKMKHDGGGGGRPKREHHEQDVVMKDHSTSSSHSSSSSDDDDDDADEEADDADDPDVVAASDPPEWEGVVGGWTDSDEEMDADLFFANFLSDGSSDEEPAAVGCQDQDADGDEESCSTDDDVDEETLAARERQRQEQFLFRSLAQTPQVQPPPVARVSPYQHRRTKSATLARPHPYRRDGSKSTTRRRRASGSSRTRAAPALVLAEDSDGRLIFADGLKLGEGVVDMDFENRRISMWGDESDDGSEGGVMSGVEESGHAIVLPSEEGDEPLSIEDAEVESETETDYEGETTVDEGLDEDGLPPPPVPTEYHHHRYGYSKAEDDDEEFFGHSSSEAYQRYLTSGIEFFQNEDATVLYGRLDFPSTRPLPDASSPTSSPVRRSRAYSDASSIAPRSTELVSMRDIIRSPDSMRSTEPISPTIPTPTPADILLGKWPLADPARGRRSTVDQASAEEHTLSASRSSTTLSSTGPLDQDVEMVLDDSLTSASPDAIPRALPTMGLFKPSVSPPPSNQQTPQPPPRTTTIESAKQTTVDPPVKPSRNIAIINAKGQAIIGGKSHTEIPSPFAHIKRRKKQRPPQPPPSLPSVMDESDVDVSFSTISGFRRAHGRSVSFAGYPSRPSSSFGAPQSSSIADLSSFLSSPDMGMNHGQGIPPLRPLLPPAPVDLSDVLESSFLDEDLPMTSDPIPFSYDPDDHFKNLSRWDRVPVGTFRRTRLHTVAETTHRPTQASPSNHVSDGFSYGAISRGPFPSPSLESALWSEHGNVKPRDVKGKGKAVPQPQRKKKVKRGVLISPVIFPVRSGSPIGDLELDGENPDAAGGGGVDVDEEEGYFSRKTVKGGREGWLRRKKMEKTTTMHRSSPFMKKAKLEGLTFSENVASTSSGTM